VPGTTHPNPLGSLEAEDPRPVPPGPAYRHQGRDDHLSRSREAACGTTRSGDPNPRRTLPGRQVLTVQTGGVYHRYMPLPRFNRLPADRQEQILAVARRHFSEYGPEAASYNKIIEAAGFSKTAAYQYFDGRDDLLSTVLDGVRARLFSALGTWVPAEAAGDFWAQLERGSQALVAHLRTHPEDLALAGSAIAQAGNAQWLGWFDAVVDNGQRLGVIRNDVDRGLLVAVTAAFFRAADEWALATLSAPGEGEASPSAPEQRQVWSLLSGLWSAPGDGQAGSRGGTGAERAH